MPDCARQNLRVLAKAPKQCPKKLMKNPPEKNSENFSKPTLGSVVLASGARGSCEVVQHSAGASTVRKRVVTRGVGKEFVAQCLASFETLAQRCPHYASFNKSIQHKDNLLVMQRPFFRGERLQHVAREKDPNPARLLKIFCEVAAAIAEFHEADLVHQNLKPNNVIIQAGQRVWLPDSFLADIHCQAALLFDDQRTHELHYLAPEQLGVINAPVSPATDLFSLGLLLVECLTGSRLTQGCSTGELLQVHAAGFGGKLDELELPAVLSQMLQKLLTLDPERRYRSARSFKADLEMVIAALAEGRSEASLVLGAHEFSGEIREPSFVGRSTELEQIQHEMQRLDSGHAGFLIIEGPAGSGKSRLLAETLVQPGQPDVWKMNLLASKEQHGMMGPFDGMLAAELAARSHQDPTFQPRLENELGDFLAIVANVFPDTARVLGWSTQSTRGRLELERARATEAADRLWAALGRMGKPILVQVDNAQVLDRSCFDFFRSWRTKQLAALEGRNVLFQLAYDSESCEPSHPLVQLRATTRLKLDRLSANEVALMAGSMVGDLPAVALEAIEQLSGGNPFFCFGVDSRHGRIKGVDSDRPGMVG